MRHNARVAREEEMYSLRQTHYATALAVAENFTKSTYHLITSNDRAWQEAVDTMHNMKREITRLNMAHHTATTSLVGATVEVAKLRAEAAQREATAEGAQSNAIMVERVATLERQSAEDARHRLTAEALLRDQRLHIGELAITICKRDNKVAKQQEKIASLRQRLSEKTEQSEADLALNATLQSLLESRKRRCRDLSSDDTLPDDASNKRERRDSDSSRGADA
jgi:hypothetical protein